MEESNCSGRGICKVKDLGWTPDKEHPELQVIVEGREKGEITKKKKRETILKLALFISIPHLAGAKTVTQRSVDHMRPF